MSRTRMFLLLVIIGVLGATLGTTHSAHADGGAPNLAYVAGAGTNGNQVAVIDIAKKQVTGHITIGNAPHALALSSDARMLFVAASSGEGVAVVDAHALTVSATIKTPAPPLNLAINYTNTPTLFITLSNGTLVLANPDTNAVRATIPLGQRLDGVGVAGPGNGTVSGQDLEIYVADPVANQVIVVNARTQAILARIAVPGGPSGIVVSPSGGIIYVLTHAGTIVVIGLASHSVLGNPLLNVPGAHFGAADYDAITNQVYVPDAAHHIVYILAPVTSAYGTRAIAEPRATLPFTNGPSAAAITFDGAYSFVATTDGGQVTMFDATTRTMLATIAVGGAPTAIITGPYPPVLNRQTSSILGIGISLLALLIIVGVAGFLYVRGKRTEGEDGH